MKHHKTAISDDVYVGFVRSLFKDAYILLIGAACHGVVALLVYASSKEPVYLLLAPILVIAGLYRYLISARAGGGAAVDDKQSAIVWERRFLIGGTIQGLAAGLFSFTAIYLVPSHFGEVAAVAVIIGSSVTIVGRNYGSRRMVMVLSLCVILPICLAWMLKGDYRYVILGLFMIPYIFAMIQLARNVREVLFAAITGELTAKFLAERFDRALNTMPHGLIMLSPEGRVIVANSEAAKALRIDDPDRLLGRSLHAVLMRGVAGGLLSQRDSRYVETQLTRALGEDRDRKLQIRTGDGRHFELSARSGNDELGVVTFEEITQRVEAEERIRHMARFDTLTDLPNRGYFHELVAEHIAGGDAERQCALAVFDLDDFKSINDTLGHPVGDGLILAVGEKLSAFATDDVIVSRFGGDEFMLFFNSIGSEEELAILLDRAFEDLNGYVDVSGHALRVQVSAGAVISTVSATDVDDMIVKADLALYKAKDAGKNGWRLFEAKMNAAFRNRQMMKSDLRSAVEARELRVVYQPIVSMDTMRIASCEALCRWDHPELGPVSPATFIPLAEEMGIISDISELVLEQATTECMKWPDDICVSVNLSAKDFHSRDVVDKVRAALECSGLPPHRLEVEVTETALLGDKTSTGEFLSEIKELGVRIALDDFGTGYSSLSYIHTLPLDKIKIDRSFLLDITHNARSLELLKGVVGLSRGIGLRVTMEGVETFEQLKILSTAVKPDLVQGFLFGSALTASGIETISTQSWPHVSDFKDGQPAAYNPASHLTAVKV